MTGGDLYHFEIPPVGTTMALDSTMINSPMNTGKTQALQCKVYSITHVMGRQVNLTVATQYVYIDTRQQL